MSGWDIEQCVLVFKRSTYDYFVGCALYLNGSKHLCEKFEAKSTQSCESQK